MSEKKQEKQSGNWGGPRPGSGRPAIKSGGKRYNLYLSDRTNALLDAGAKVAGSRSEVIQEAVEEWAERRKIEPEDAK